MNLIMEAGVQVAEAKTRKGHTFEVAILAPREVGGDTDTVPLSAVVMALDWKLSKKIDMVEQAREFLSSAYVLDVLDPALPVVLSSVIEGKGLYAYGMGEFFLFYGRFQQKYGLVKGKDTREKMMELVGDKAECLKPYIEHGRWKRYPLPYAVRNILSHVGSNPNQLDAEGKDLQKAIQLLKSWIKL